MITTLLAAGLFQSSLFLTFFTILGIGFTYILMTGVLGAIGDAFGDGDVEASAEHTDDGTISIFSPKVIAIFMVGFGGAGCIAAANELTVLGATVSGLVTGAAFGGIALAGLKWLSSQRANSSVTTDQTVGRYATVTIAIPGDGHGQVSLSINGQYMTYTARSTVSHVYKEGATVQVLRVEGTTLVVG